MDKFRSDIRLRRADVGDIDALSNLINACHPKHANLADKLHTLITSDGSYVFCVDDSATQNPVACVGVAFTDTAHISPWVVSPHLQGDGIGNTMLSAIRTFAGRHAKSRNISHLTLSLPTAVCPNGFSPTNELDDDGLTIFISPL